jgi:hypothetical protein
VSGLLRSAGAALAAETGMTETQARGTLRLLLKERGIDPTITRKPDLRALLGPPLVDALEKRHVLIGEDGLAAVRRAIDGAIELDDAYDLFSDME